MTTFSFVFLSTPPRPNPLPHACCACGKAPATGIISYAGKVHEPHCEGCCIGWERYLKGASMLGMVFGLEDFREWQANRRKA